MSSVATLMKARHDHATATNTIDALMVDPTRDFAITSKVLKIILLRTNARLTSNNGVKYDVTSKALGAGVFRISLTPAA